MDDLTRRWIMATRRERYAEAWAIERQVLAARPPATRDDPALPYHRRWVWDGRPLDGCDVLVRCYHGLGDTIQFARYLPHLAASAARVTVEAPARLHPLLHGVAGIDRLHAFDPARPLPPAGCDVEITELAFALERSPRDAPAPYLSARPAPLEPGTIGLCHAAGDWDRERWVPPELLQGLCERHACITLVSAPTALPVRNPQGCPFDLAATASLVGACALVVTVDTMVAHLAGALGRPTWLLLKREPDWRWDPARRTSPWYPTMRLYVQPPGGGWRDTIARVERDLDERNLLHGQPAQPVGARILG